VGFFEGIAQPQMIDEIVAVVGDEIVLYSDIQIQKNQIKASGYNATITDCEVLGDILFEKLMLNQGKVDSVEVSEEMVNSELEKRLAVFIGQIGSQEALEEYYGKSIAEIREEFFDVLEDQIMVQRMEGQISSAVNVTPNDVQSFFNSIPPDSLPFINASVEIAQIVIIPSASVIEIERVRGKLNEYKEGVETGAEDFETLAVLYSDDPGSSAKGGKLGMQSRGTWVPEFDEVAFKLKDGEISAPFKTDYGWHIMQMVERRGEMYNANHILLIPKITSIELNEAKAEIDSIRTLVLRDSLSFAFAASKFSDDERSKNQNGMLVNSAKGSTIFEIDELDPTLFLVIDTMEVGEVSKSFYYQGQGRERGYKIVKLMTETDPHRANMEDDYQIMQSMTTERLRAIAIEEWVTDHIQSTYIKLVETYQTCDFNYPWNKPTDDSIK
jgi:peptidyl-prolyl cis-trans isomerase SurA